MEWSSGLFALRGWASDLNALCRISMDWRIGVGFTHQGRQHRRTAMHCFWFPYQHVDCTIAHQLASISLALVNKIDAEWGFHRAEPPDVQHPKSDCESGLARRVVEADYRLLCMIR